MRVGFALSPFFAAAALAACGGDDVVLPECLLDQAEFRDIEVSADEVPRFSWCGAPANNLLVRRGVQNLWRIECDEDEAAPLCLDPTVTYGDSVAGTVTTVAALPLGTGALEVCLGGTEGRPPTLCQSFTR